MPRFEVKVTKREGDWSASQGATQSQKSKSIIDCLKSLDDTPELRAGDRSTGIPLSCRAARPDDGGKRAS